MRMRSGYMISRTHPEEKRETLAIESHSEVLMLGPQFTENLLVEGSLRLLECKIHADVIITNKIS